MKKMSALAVHGLAVLSTNALAKMSNVVVFVSGEVVVMMTPGLKRKLLSQKSLLGVQMTKEMNLLSGDFVVLKTHNKSALSLISELNSMPEVEYAEPNFIYKAIRSTPSVKDILHAPADADYGK